MYDFLWLLYFQLWDLIKEVTVFTDARALLQYVDF